MADLWNNPTSHSDIVPEIWATNAILAANDHTMNPLLLLSNNDSAAFANGGDKKNYSIQSRVTLATVSQTAEIDRVQFSTTTVQLTIDTHKGNPIAVTSQLDALSNQDPLFLLLL